MCYNTLELTKLYSTERGRERERENFISQVRHQITISTIIIDYNGRLPEKANAHQRWPPLTQ